jgi:hypothetical protein
MCKSWLKLINLRSGQQINVTNIDPGGYCDTDGLGHARIVDPNDHRYSLILQSGTQVDVLTGTGIVLGPFTVQSVVA